MNKNDSILFVVPPHCEPSMPLLAAAQLSAFAAKINLPFHFIDLNIILRNSLLNTNEDNSPKSYDNINSYGEYWNDVKEINRVWNNPNSTVNYSITWDGIDRVDKWYKNKTLSQFVSLNSGLSEHEKIYLSHLWKKVDSVKPTVAAISILFESQFLDSVTIGKLLKKRYPGLIVVFGGGLISSYVKNQNHIFDLFSGIVDIFFSGEGEYLLSVIKNHGIESFFQKRKNSTDSKKLPLFLSSKILKLDWNTRYSSLFDYNIFDDVDYFSPNKIFPYKINPACYWGRCSFCADHQYNNIIPNTCSLDDHFEFLIDLIKKKGVFGIMFQDSALSPKILADMSDSFLKRNVKCLWGTNVRFERALANRVFLEKMYLAGCRFLRFGLESGSQRIVDDMNKGFQVETAKKIMINCRSIGILTHIYLICGYPGENIEDLNKTKTFVLNDETHPDMFNISKFIAYQEAIKGQMYFKKISEAYWDVPYVPTVSNDLKRFMDQLYEKHSARFSPSRVLISPAHTLAFYNHSSKWITT